MRIEEAIGARLKEERERQGLTLEAVGAEMGKYLDKPWTAQAVWQAERGQRDFRAAQLIALALVLEVPVVQLLAPLVGRASESIEIDGYALTEEDAQRLFMAVASPGADAMFLDLWGRLEQAGHGVGKSSHDLRSLQDEIYGAADVIRAQIETAVLSPKAQQRIARAAKKRSGERDER